MKVVDPGHVFDLDTIDGDGEQARLVFVKREGINYPGNVGAHAGTTIQEVLRALISRGEYVNGQVPSDETTECVALWRRSLRLMEERASRRHGRLLVATDAELESGATKCAVCGHHGCVGECSRGGA